MHTLKQALVIFVGASVAAIGLGVATPAGAAAPGPPESPLCTELTHLQSQLENTIRVVIADLEQAPPGLPGVTQVLQGLQNIEGSDHGDALLGAACGTTTTTTTTTTTPGR